MKLISWTYSGVTTYGRVLHMLPCGCAMIRTCHADGSDYSYGPNDPDAPYDGPWNLRTDSECRHEEE